MKLIGPRLKNWTNFNSPGRRRAACRGLTQPALQSHQPGPALEHLVPSLLGTTHPGADMLWGWDQPGEGWIGAGVAGHFVNFLPQDSEKNYHSQSVCTACTAGIKPKGERQAPVYTLGFQSQRTPYALIEAGGCLSYLITGTKYLTSPN